MTIGALSFPFFTSSLIASPNCARSPYPSQQMRARQSLEPDALAASSIQRFSISFCGNSSSTRSSVVRMSAGSPESATQRNGPRPSQNSGRMYAGTNPGNIVGVLDAVLEGKGADVVAVVEGHRAHLLQLQHAFNVARHGSRASAPRRPSGSRWRSSSAASSVMPFGTYPFSGSCAEVWSVRMSGTTPRSASSGMTSAQLPTRPTEMFSFLRTRVLQDAQRLVERVRP